MKASLALLHLSDRCSHLGGRSAGEQTQYVISVIAVTVELLEFRADGVCTSPLVSCWPQNRFLHRGQVDF